MRDLINIIVIIILTALAVLAGYCQYAVNGFGLAMFGVFILMFLWGCKLYNDYNIIK